MECLKNSYDNYNNLKHKCYLYKKSYNFTLQVISLSEEERLKERRDQRRGETEGETTVEEKLKE